MDISTADVVAFAIGFVIGFPIGLTLIVLFAKFIAWLVEVLNL